MNHSQFEDGFNALFARVVSGDGRLDKDIRTAVAKGDEPPEPLQRLTEKVHKHAYRVTDEDVQELLDGPFDEEQVFEAVVSGAVGAAMNSWQAFTSKQAEVTDAS